MQESEPSIISIQSLVSSGYVGNSIAALAIELHGIEVVKIPTVLLSTHAEDNVYYGQVISGELFRLLIKGIKEIGLCQKSDYFITGYINHIELIDLSAQFIVDWKAVNPKGVYVYDPVFGDTRANGLYIDKQVALHSLDKLLELAQIITPNHFELEFILQESISSINQLDQALSKRKDLLEKTIILTGAILQDTQKGNLEVIIIDKGIITRLTTQLIDIAAVGTGDLFTSVLTSQLYLGKSVVQASKLAMEYVTAVLQNIHHQGSKQLNAKAIIKSLPVLELK
ncbi:pyridoxal kinase [Myroides sp. LJL119]